MSDSVRPHRWQPTRLPHPWDFPGKNTGVGCHFLLQCMKVKSESEVAQSCLTLSMDCSLAASSVHGIFQARVLEWGAIAFSSWLSPKPWKSLRRYSNLWSLSYAAWTSSGNLMQCMVTIVNNTALYILYILIVLTKKRVTMWSHMISHSVMSNFVTPWTV